MRNTMPIIALTQVEKPTREGSIHSWDRPAAQLPGRARLLPPPRLLCSRDHYPAGLQMVSCSLISPFFPKKMCLPQGMLLLGAGIPRGCPSASPLLLEGTRALPNACTLPLNIASVRTLFLACILSALFSRSPAGFRPQTPQLGFLVVRVLSQRGRMCRGWRAHVALAGSPTHCVLAPPAADCCLPLIRSFFLCLAAGFFCPFSPL